MWRGGPATEHHRIADMHFRSYDDGRYTESADCLVTINNSIEIEKLHANPE